MTYNFEIEYIDDEVWIVSDVIGRVKIIDEEQAKFARKQDQDFQSLLIGASDSLYKGNVPDTDKAMEIVNEMMRRWGGFETNIRAINWQILECLEDESDEE